MKKLEEFFKRRKANRNFPDASSGHKLGDSQPTPASSSSSSVSGEAKKAAAEAAERRQAQQVEKSKIKFPKRPPPEMEKEEEKFGSDEEKSNDVRRFNCPVLEIFEFSEYNNLKGQMMEKIKSQFGDDRIICGALLIRNCNPTLIANRCISTLETILCNLETDDEEAFAKFSKLRKVKIESKVLAAAGGIEFLEGIGFRLSEDGEWYIFSDSSDGLKEKLSYYLDVLKSSEVFPIILDRETLIYDLNAINTPNLTFDDEVFEMSKDELSREQQNLKQAADKELTLMTKAMREKFIIKKTKPYFTRVRYKSLDCKMIEATFKTGETINDFIQWLKESHSMQDIENYDLYHGTKIIPRADWSKTFLDLELYPRITFYQRLRG